MKINALSLVKYALLYIVIWCVSPPLSYGGAYRLLALAAIAYIIYWHCKTNRLKIEKHFVITIFLIIYMIILGMATGDGAMNKIGVYIILGVLLSAEVITNPNFSKKDFYFIIPVTFLLCTIWNICSLKGIAETPNIMRILAKNSYISVVYAKRGIGGFGYIYMVIILLPISIDCVLRKENNTIYRIMAGAFLISGYILVFQSQYFLAMILSILLLGIYFVMKIEKITTRVILLFLLLLGFIIVYANADKILLWLISINNMRSIDLKLRSTYDLLISGGNIEDSEFSTRFVRYRRDIDYIFSHPIFGGFTRRVTGNHSHVLSYMAQYGIPIGSIYLSMIIRPFLKLEIVKNAFVFVVLTIFFIIALMNTIVYMFSIAIYIITPLYFYYLKEGKDIDDG